MKSNYNYNQVLVEDVIIALDKMFLSRDKIFEENKYSNYRFAQKIIETEYEPAKNQLRQTLLMLLSDKTKGISNQE
tara:strand:+ start:9474 stop:9701 length:228 start_codon:yes stop_codon:yes gene_type:complete